MLPFVAVVIVMLLAAVGLVSFWRLCNALSQTEVWRSKLEKSPSWFTINDLTLYQWQVMWAVLTGRLANSENPEIRQRARRVRACLFAALLLGLILAAIFELETSASFLSTIFMSCGPNRRFHADARKSSARG